MEIEKIKKEIPKRIPIEIDIEEWFPERRPFISHELLDSLEEDEIYFLKQRLKDRGYKESDIDRALEEVDIKFDFYIVHPDLPGPVKIKWERTDPWRGYYTSDVPEVDSKEAKKRIGTGYPLKMSLHYVARDPQENERFLQTAIDLLRRAGFLAIPILFPTSNVFSVNAELLVIPSPEKAVFNRTDLEFLKEFDDLYVDKYTRSFSIFTGTTRPIDPYIRELVRDAERLMKRKLGEVVG